MTAVSKLEDELHVLLRALLSGKGKDYEATQIKSALQGQFKALASGSYALVTPSQTLTYRLRKDISTAAGCSTNDGGATVRVLSLKEIGKGQPHETAVAALEAQLFNASGDIPQYSTDGLFGKDVSISDLELDLMSRLHDHTFDGQLEDAVRRCLEMPLAGALAAVFGQNIGPMLAQDVATTARTLVYAELLGDADACKRCFAALQVAPGAVLLGRKAGEKRTVKDGAPCYVLAQ